jgi:hypothetical protein
MGGTPAALGDAAALLAAAGDLTFDQLRGRLRCRCGQRPCGIIVSGPAGWDRQRAPG